MYDAYALCIMHYPIHACLKDIIKLNILSGMSEISFIYPFLEHKMGIF